MPWIRNSVTNPSANTVVIKFAVPRFNQPLKSAVSILSIFISSSVSVSLVFRRMNYGETTIRTWWRVYAPANQPILISPVASDDPLEPLIGIPEAGTQEKIDCIVESGVTGTVFVAMEVAGGEIVKITGDVW
jgi:hypothetical protein